MFKKWDKKTDMGKSYYDIQTEVFRKALGSDGHSLNELLRLMRAKGISSVYLCGTRLDSDLCFGSNDLGLAISVLPEDARKAAEPGYHPGSTEVYVVFQGSFVIEMLDNGLIREETPGQFNVVVIPPGQCHRVLNKPEQEAASIIVKTNLHHEPGVVRCADCTCYQIPDECPLWRSWDKEK